MSFAKERLEQEAALGRLETDLVGLELRAAKLRDDLRAQTSPLRPVKELSPEAINYTSLKLVEVLVEIGEKRHSVEDLRQGLGK